MTSAVVDGIYDVILTYCSCKVPRFRRLLAYVAGFVLGVGFCFFGFEDDILALDGPIKLKPIPAIADVSDLFSTRLTLPVSRCCRNS